MDQITWANTLPLDAIGVGSSMFESKPSSLSTDSSSSRALLRERSMQSHTLHHSSETWERHRLQITELYVTQGKKLREVADLMKTTYKFKATERQYKRRITHWGLDKKNIRDHDMRFILAKELKRKREGKETEFEINGRHVQPQKMHRFRQRKGLREPDLMKISTVTPFSITYRTPRQNAHDKPPPAGNPAPRNHEPRDLDDTSDEISHLIQVNEAWLKQRQRARTHPKLLFSYAELAWTTRIDLLLAMQGGDSKCSFQKLAAIFPFWEDFRIEFLLSTFDGKIPAYRSEILASLGEILGSVLQMNTLVQSMLRLERYSSYFTTDEAVQRSELTLIRACRCARHEPHPAVEAQCEAATDGQSADAFSAAASPYERWSQRYDLSTSPDWIKAHMTPSNPLTYLAAAPVGTPWDKITTPVTNICSGVPDLRILDEMPMTDDYLTTICELY